MKKLIYFFSLTALIFLFGCLDQIDLEVTEGEQFFVVSGNIHSGAPPYSIKLAKSSQFNSVTQGAGEKITNAVVKISDDAGNIETLTEIEDGLYQTAPNGLQGTVGRTYTLEIEYNGQTYFSHPEKMRPVVSPASLETEYTIEQDFNDAGNLVNIETVSLFVNTPFPTDEEVAYLRWNVQGTYEYDERPTPDHINPLTCYISENIDFDNVAVSSSEGVTDNFLQKEKLLSRGVNYKFAIGYCFTVIQQSLTKEAYEFWEKVGAEFERTGDIFETPPSKIKGNIFNEKNAEEFVLGYFSASAVDTSHLLVLGVDVGSPRPQCQPWPPPPATCTNCLLIANSTLERSACWE